ncbi:MAG: ATP-binding protein [Halioglobus sp.]|nr:ATP-binding protein [Halioglobus sp.]
MSTTEMVTVAILVAGLTLLLRSIIVMRESLPDFARERAQKDWRYPKIFVWFFVVCFATQILMILLNYPSVVQIFSSISLLLLAIFIVLITAIARRNVLVANDLNTVKGIIETDSLQHQLEATELQKLAAVGEVAGGLAHDFNNLLSIVIGNLDEIRDVLPAESTQAQAQLDAALTAALGGVKVSRSLLAVARRDKRQIQTYDVNMVIREIMPLIHSSIGANVAVRSELTPEKLLCRLNASGLDNVILNLVINARDAMRTMERNNTLTLRTKRVKVHVDFSEGLVPGWYSLVEIRDTGRGMPKKVLNQVFEPFFTTKERNEGTGLGLAMVQRYLKDVGGVALIESTEGLGTAVRLYMPLQDADTETNAIEFGNAQSQQRIEPSSILVAEPDGEFDFLAAEAARICRVPMALISLVDHDRRWLKASVGIDYSDIAHEQVFFAHAIQHDQEVLVVPDITADPRFSEKMLVLGGLPLRFYASSPLLNSDGAMVGALSIMDYVPGTLSHAQKIEVQRLTVRAMSYMAGTPKSDGTAAKSLTEAAGSAALPLKAAERFNVLIVDDEVGLCELAATWLSSVGYGVTTAAGPAEALEYLTDGDYAILFTDIVMPGPMDGIELAKQAKLMQPDLRVLLTSGYADRLIHEYDFPGEVISKPYRKTDLVRAISRL